MEHPIAFKFIGQQGLGCHSIQIEPIEISNGETSSSPAIIVTRKVISLDDLQAGVIDKPDVISVVEGDWTKAILIVYPHSENEIEVKQSKEIPPAIFGDEAFIHDIPKKIPKLVALGKTLIKQIRKAGITGTLEKNARKRWVNSPVNSFTIKIQPQKENFQFTLYGNPSAFEHDGFLQKDQNSYSRGWIKEESDIEKFVSFALQSYESRTSKI